MTLSIRASAKSPSILSPSSLCQTRIHESFHVRSLEHLIQSVEGGAELLKVVGVVHRPDHALQLHGRQSAYVQRYSHRLVPER